MTTLIRGKHSARFSPIVRGIVGDSSVVDGFCEALHFAGTFDYFVVISGFTPSEIERYWYYHFRFSAIFSWKPGLPVNHPALFSAKTTTPAGIPVYADLN